MKSMPALFVSLALLGCGGGGSSNSSNPTPVAENKGVGILTIKWPTDGRQIPLAANSLVATLKLGGKAVASKTVARPSGGGPTTAVITGLAYGSYTVEVKAYPTTDGLATDASAVPQGTGTGLMTVTEDFAGTAAVALDSTVVHLGFSPAVPAFDKGTSLNLAAVATDKDGSIVLLAANGGTEALTWSIDSTHNATLTPAGASATLAGVHSGGANVTATMVVNDAGVTVTATVPVTVRPISDGTGTVSIH